MAWIQIRINANAVTADAVSDLLMEAGSASAVAALALIRIWIQAMVISFK